MAHAGGSESAETASRLETIAAIFVLRADGAALLQHRDDKPGLLHAGMWVPPGGHVEAGESLVEGARRELLEETEYDAPDLKFLTVFDFSEQGWPASRVTVFWCRYDGVQPVVCREGQALAFVERQAAAYCPIPHFMIDVWDAALAVAGAITEKPHS